MMDNCSKLNTPQLSVVLLLLAASSFRLFIECSSHICTTPLGMIFHLTAIALAEGAAAQYLLLVILEAFSVFLISRFLIRQRVVWRVLAIVAIIILSVPAPGAKSVPPYTIIDCFCL